MQSLRFFVLVICYAVTMSLLVASTEAHAQTQNESLGLTPAVMDASVKRGTTYNQNFTIANNTRTRLRFRPSLGDYWYGENNERVFGRAGTQPRSASLWVQSTPAEIIIEPNSSGIITAVITVPLTAQGGYYTMPYFDGEAADLPVGKKHGVGTAGATFGVRLGGLLMLATVDASEYNVEIMNGIINPPTESAELEMHLDVRNRSTAHARLRGMFAILNEAGKPVGRGRIEEKPYLPGQRKLLDSAWSGDLPPGRYTVVVTLTYDRAGMEPATLVYDMPFEHTAATVASK